jgi:hypothetical protein
LFDLACRAGSTFGCTNLGAMVEKGEGVPSDSARAARLYAAGCEPEGPQQWTALLEQRHLGVMVRCDSARPGLCGTGDALGCLNLGLLLVEGRGVERDEQRAAQLFTRACDAGQPTACFNLGVALAGQAPSREQAKAALPHFSRACELGVADGCSAAEQIRAALAASPGP